LLASSFVPAEAAIVSALFEGGDSVPGAQSVPSNGNDCSGYFNGLANGFNNCEIGSVFDDPTTIATSVIKYNRADGDPIGGTAGSVERNTALHPTISGSEFAFSNLPDDESKSGTWTYTPGAGDPGVRFWAAKAGTAFTLFWDIGDDTSGTCAGGEDIANFTVACLDLAVSVTEGTWTTPNNRGLSHITFYHGDLAPVPLPASVIGLMAGLGALGGLRRLRKAT
jgi:hypothetical protein